MLRDTNNFRQRYQRWKNGEKVYENGRILPYPLRVDSYYDQNRAYQLGYKHDESGHMPTRDYKTGRYLKSVTHPTISKSIYKDMELGYDVKYENGSLYSQPNFGSQWKNKIPGYKGGKNSYKSRYSGIVLDYIKAVENPHNSGYDPKTDTWWISNKKGDDHHGIGYGLDLRYNKNITAPLSTNAMLQAVDKNLDYFSKVAKKHIKNFNSLSDKKKALILGSMYRGDAKFVYKQPWSILTDECAAEAVSNYYDKLNLSRGKQTRMFFNQPRLNKPIYDVIYNPIQIPEQPNLNIIKQDQVIPFASIEPTQKQVDSEKFTFTEPTRQKNVFDAIQLINTVLKPFDPITI